MTAISSPLGHDWRRVDMASSSVHRCARCGVMAATGDFVHYYAMIRHGPIDVNQIVPDDCQKVLLDFVHGS